MSRMRRHENPGRRERLARKRHRRAHIWRGQWGAEAVPLKVGRVHSWRMMIRVLAVADRRNAGGERALESARRSLPSTIL
jgi:hypothetical protein